MSARSCRCDVSLCFRDISNGELEAVIPSEERLGELKVVIERKPNLLSPETPFFISFLSFHSDPTSSPWTTVLSLIC